MAFSSKLISRQTIGDKVEEVYRLFFTAVQTGTVQLPSLVGGAYSALHDLRKVFARAFDLSTAGTVLTVALDIETGLVTVAAAVANNALTGETGGTAGGHTFTATGAVTGQTVSGTNIPAQAIVMDVDSTTVTIDLPLEGAVSTDVVGNTAAILVVEYYN